MGFTLVELMIAMGVGGVVLTGVYSAYVSQAKLHNTQELTADMQSNLRTALELLQMDLRLAGSDISTRADAGFLVAAPNCVSFTMDIKGGEEDGRDNDGDGLVNEGSNNLDDDGDGLTDEADEAEWYDGDTSDKNEKIIWFLDGTTLKRNNLHVAQNVQQLNLVYFDQDGNRLNDDGLGSVTHNIEEIRSVQVTLIGSAGGVERPMTYRFPDQKIYQNQVREVILNMSKAPDELRRRMVSSQVYCRNMK